MCMCMRYNRVCANNYFPSSLIIFFSFIFLILITASDVVAKMHIIYFVDMYNIQQSRRRRHRPYQQ